MKEKPGKEDEYHSDDDTKTDVDESQRRNKEGDDKLKDNESEAKKEVEDKDGDRKNEERYDIQSPQSLHP